MAESDFVLAVGPDNKKRRVPKHYLDNPKLGYRLPPSTRAKEPATPAKTRTTRRARNVREPATPAITTTVKEPAEPENQKEARG